MILFVDKHWNILVKGGIFWFILEFGIPNSKTLLLMQYESGKAALE